MRKFIVLLSLILISQTAYAKPNPNIKPKQKPVVNNYSTTEFNDYVNNKNIYGAKLDAPYLIELSNNLYLGAEGGKDLYQTNSNEGYFVYGKVTLTGTLVSFVKTRE